jgi:hypothetical protein
MILSKPVLFFTHFATLLALASLRAYRTAITPARLARSKVYPHPPHRPFSQPATTRDS